MIPLAVLAGCAGDGPRCEGAGCRPPVTDEDGDGYAVDVDCDDGDASFHPAATDPPGDGIDHDCSGTDAPGADLLDAGALRAWDSPVTFSWAGRGLSAGDIDGDGMDELGVSAPGPLNCGPEPSYGCDNVHADRGNVWIIAWEGSSWAERAHFEGPGSFLDAIGEHVDLTGDVNGDGLKDLVTGSKEITSVFAGPGPWDGIAAADVSREIFTYMKGTAPDDDGDGADSVLVAGHEATADLILGYRDLTSLTQPNSAAVTLFATAPNDELAMVPPAYPDLDGDGTREWLLGAPHHPGESELAGAAFAVPSGLTGDVLIADVGVSWLGTVPEGDAGLSVADAGDVDGDGLDEGLVGAPLDDTAGTHAGRAFLLDGLPSAPARLDDSALTIEGEFAYDWLGWRVTGPVDLDEDGFADLVLGAPGDSYRSVLPGKVHVLFGPLEGVVSAADADRTWVGEHLAASAGSGLALGDFDGDGRTDLAVGAPRTTTPDGGDDAGRVYLLLAADLQP